jgi:hypothetical protein
MRTESLPSIKELYNAIEAAAVDLYGFSVVCSSGIPWVAEPELLDTLMLGLERFWFTENSDGDLSHQEFRVDFFKAFWEKCRGKQVQPQIGIDVQLGHDEMPFNKLPQSTRAALYLRSKKRLSYTSIALVLGLGESIVREEVALGREFLLGRQMRELQWSEDDF